MPRDRLFTYGDLDIRVFPPEKFHYNKSNDYSLAVLVKNGRKKSGLVNCLSWIFPQSMYTRRATMEEIPNGALN